MLGTGWDATEVDANGDTTLHEAALRGVNDVVRVLVASGAKLDVKNKIRRPESKAEPTLGGWKPWRIAQGVYLNGGPRQQPQTAALLKQMMQERGLWTEEEVAEEARPF